MYTTSKNICGMLGAALIISSISFASAQTTSCFQIQASVLEIGSRDVAPYNEVTQLQEFLVARGHLSVTPTGYFGEQTSAAVKAYQATKGISQVGRVGPLTKTAIAQDTCSSEALSQNENTQVGVSSGTTNTTSTSAAVTPSATITTVGGTSAGCAIISGKSSCPIEVSWISKNYNRQVGLSSCELTGNNTCAASSEWYSGTSGSQVFLLRNGIERFFAVWGYDTRGILVKAKETILSGYCASGLITEGDRCVVKPYVVGSATTSTSTNPGTVTPPPVTSGNGTYKLFVNGVRAATNTNISRADALANCNANMQAGRNVTRTGYPAIDNSIVVCVWNDEQIASSVGAGIKWRNKANFNITVSDLSNSFVSDLVTYYLGSAQKIGHESLIVFCGKIAKVSPSSTITCTWNGVVVWTFQPTAPPRPTLTSTSNDTLAVTTDGYTQTYTSATYSTVTTLTPEEALRMCLGSGMLDNQGTTKSIRCTWNGVEFFNQVGDPVPTNADAKRALRCATTAGILPGTNVSCQSAGGSVANVPVGTYVKLSDGNSQSPFSGVYTNVTRSTALIDCASDRINTVFELSLKCTWNGEVLLDLPAPPYDPDNGGFTLGPSSTTQTTSSTATVTQTTQSTQSTSSSAVCQDVRGTFMSGAQKIEWSCGCLTAPAGTGWNAVESGCFHRVVQ